MIKKEQSVEVLQHLNSARELLSGTGIDAELARIGLRIEDRTVELDWKAHFGNFYKAVYKDKWLIVRLMNNFTFDRVEYCILGDKDCKGIAKNVREAEAIMMRYLDAL